MGRDKATAVFEGKTLVERTVSALSPRCAPLFVVAAPGQALPTLEAEILRDEVRGVVVRRRRRRAVTRGDVAGRARCGISVRCGVAGIVRAFLHSDSAAGEEDVGGS